MHKACTSAHAQSAQECTRTEHTQGHARQCASRRAPVAHSMRALPPRARARHAQKHASRTKACVTHKSMRHARAAAQPCARDQACTHTRVEPRLTIWSRYSLLSARFWMRSSTVPSLTRRYTCTGLTWPMRCTRAMACRYNGSGGGQGSGCERWRALFFLRKAHARA